MTKPKPTKTAKLQAMLRAPKGASLDAICKTTGWQAHSARAALSGLRKTGLVIERQTAPSGGSVYRIVPDEEIAS